MKVLLTKPLLQADRDYLTDRLDQGIELVEPSQFDQAGVIEAMTGCTVVLGGMLGDAVLEAATRSDVAFFQIPWTGVDTLDFESLKRHGVTVCNSHSNGGIVAEHAVALMLSAAKRIPYHDALMRSGHWNRVSPDGNVVSPFSRTVAGTRAVIVGFGSIGQAIARRLTGFDVDIVAVNRRGTCDDSALANVRIVAVTELVSCLDSVDWVFLAAPLTENTRGLIGAREITAMGPDATLINVSRGALVDETALFEALETGSLGGAAIDTWYHYPSSKEPVTAPSLLHDFASLPNVIMSPHRAGYAIGGFPHLDDAIENINRAARGQAPQHVVSEDRGY